ncbi:Bacterial alpha-L-rhamnosidase [Actinobaculum suis]|uniref:alpha-L-rhamnosidase n=2 Tax=Actinobaculum suis TaxID=1657 RepID=A0A7Z8Y838_9ACTO|nr:family 78 glycoside hydrolase catalytic domain [Actinobaculum suis]VDG75942.1 Bacterial alpha-L-rhamnosidase [Actinobaculum suis]
MRRNTDGKPDELRVNLLRYAKNAPKEEIAFSWTNHATHRQESANISIFQRVTDEDPLVTSGWIDGPRHISVFSETISQALQDGELYYWTVTVKYADGSEMTSDRVPFVTAIGEEWQGTDLAWLPGAKGTLTRAEVNADETIERAILSVTGFDTEAQLRHLFTAYVNETEIGVGPTRRQGSSVFYNTWDVTAALRKGTNVLGLYSYSEAPEAGILMQLTYFYKDGSRKVVYNSSRDRQATRMHSLDTSVYRKPDASIGTYYFHELAQNVDLDRYPNQWLEPGDGNKAMWQEPTWKPVAYELRPSIVENTQRHKKAPVNITKNAEGIFTVDFGQVVLGDIELRVPERKAATVRVDLSEELFETKARVPMRTGNAYSEEWTFTGKANCFSGQSLKAFRYATITFYPGELTTENVSALVHKNPEATSIAQMSTENALLNEIFELGSRTSEATSFDAVVDSVSRERRPYEGDELVAQRMRELMSNDYLTGRNTWNYLMENPTQYTEYRLMTILGVARDYRHTGDLRYIEKVYPRLQELSETVEFDSDIGLVRASGETIDLVDWPRTETPDFDFDETRYKTVINAVAAASFSELSMLADNLGKSYDAAHYAQLSETIRKTGDEKLFDPKTGGYRDGLDINGQPLPNYLRQNDYVALALNFPSSEEIAARIAESVAADAGQSMGSIYMGYFYYTALVESGKTREALEALSNPDETNMRSYAHVLRNLGATLAPEAWDPSTKENMTFSHAWGTGGSIGLMRAVADVNYDPLQSVTHVFLGETPEGKYSVQVPTLGGSVLVETERRGENVSVNISSPSDSELRLSLPSTATSMVLDGTTVPESGTAPESGTSLESRGVETVGGDHELTYTLPR